MRFAPYAILEAVDMQSLVDRLRSSGWENPGPLIEVQAAAKGQGALRPDVVLLHNLYPLAAVEAKFRVGIRSAEAIKQAMHYAEALDLPFALGVTADGIWLQDQVLREAQRLDQLPSPAQLWQALGRDLDPSDPRLVAPLLGEGLGSSATATFVQGKAIAQVLDALVDGQTYATLRLRTGEGKTIAIKQLAWKLLHSGFAERVTYVTNRRELADQAKTILAPVLDQYGAGDGKARLDIKLVQGLESEPDDRPGILICGTTLAPSELERCRNAFPGRPCIAVAGDIHGIANITLPPLTLKATAAARAKVTKHLIETTEELNVPQGFQQVRLKDVAAIIPGRFEELASPATTGKRRVKLIEAASLLPDGTLDLDGATEIPVEDRKDSNLARTGDIILLPYPRGGTRFPLAIVRGPSDFSLAAKHPLLVVRPDPSTNEALYSFLSSGTGQARLLAQAEGSVRPRLSLESLESLLVLLPLPGKQTDQQRQASDKALTAIGAVIRSIEAEVLPHLRRAEKDGQDVPVSPTDVAEGSDLIQSAAGTLYRLRLQLVSQPLTEIVEQAFPMPIALPYHRYAAAQFNTFEKLMRLIDLYEAAVYFTYNVVLSDWLRRLRRLEEGAAYPNDRLTQVKAYANTSIAKKLDFLTSVVEHANLRQELAGTAKSELFLRELGKSKFAAHAHTVREFRNTVYHGNTASESRQKHLLEKHTITVNAALEELSFLRDYRLVSVPNYAIKNGQLVRQIIAYTGVMPGAYEEVVAEDGRIPETIATVDSNHVALMNTEGELLNLFPTYQLESGPQTNYDEQLCYMKVMRKGQVEGESVMGVGEMNLKGADYLGRLLSPKVH